MTKVEGECEYDRQGRVLERCVVVEGREGKEDAGARGSLCTFGLA
jgi:hypothetical protein